MAQFLELKPDRNLLDSNFEGYKLSLKTLSTIKHDLKFPISKKLVDPNHYSYLHAKIFGLFNFLTGETNNSTENIYFIDNKNNLNKANINHYSNTFDIFNVWSVPCSESRKKDYNISMKLLSEKLAVVSDGAGTLFLLDTGDRSTDYGWNIIFMEDLLQSRSFFIQDCLLKDAELHLVLCRIEQGEKKAKLAIHWITLINRDDEWNVLYSRELVATDDVSYLYLEPSGEAIYVASTSGCKFISDSQKQTDDELSEVISENCIVSNEDSFKWSNDAEFVVIHVILDENVKKEDINVSCVENHLRVESNERCFIDGALFAEVDSDLTTIHFHNKLLEINLVKKQQNILWDRLLKGDNDTHNVDESCSKSEGLELNTKKEDPQQGITFNTEQVEECDFSNGAIIFFERICVQTHKVTHKFNFGSNQILLTVETNNYQPPSLGIRNDVDICLWQPYFQNGIFELKHVSTLLALGYIQASKQQKKFIACPPNNNYSLICETTRHLFLYREKCSISSGELKNRISGTRVKSVAEQQVISIPNEEVLGIYASSNSIYLLGENYLMYIKT